MATQEDFQQIVAQVQSAIQQGCKGNPEPIKALFSHTEDVTIMGGWGAFERGWKPWSAWIS